MGGSIVMAADCRERGAHVRADLAHTHDLFGRMHRVGRPGQFDVGEPVAIRDHASEGLVSGHAVGPAAMQRRDQSVQLVAFLLQVAGGSRPMLFGDEIAFAPGGRKLLQHARLLGLGRVDFEAVAAKADAVHTLAYDLKGGGFLRNEQHRLTMRETVGDRVGNGLAFACSRRPEQHEVRTALGRDDSGDL